MENVYQQYKDRAEFILVYIREAHPDSILFTKKEADAAEELLKITQTETADERKAVAQMCCATLNLTMPTVIDREDNKVNAAYAGWPDRLYVVGVDGNIAHQGAPGPRGFRVSEVVNWLKENAAPK